MWSTIRGTTWISPFWIVLILIGSTGAVRAQTAWFVDGYHGGVYGHYPDGYTRFIVDTLKQHPAWKINLEIEPETWDRVKTNEPTAYAELQALAADQTAGGRIEFVNPTYAQSYLWNISGESIIRQFQYGIKKVREHFTGAVFSTYSAEEPCFTSALPGILKSLGYRNAALKNPDTCWGGYVHGEDHPLGLVLQYSGIGLWGRRYAIAGPTTVHYALVPHRGRWDQAEISGESAAWNEPLMAVLANSNGPTREGRQSMLELSGSGWEMTTMTVEGKSRFIRLFNAAGDDRAQRLSLDGRAANVSLVELNGNTRETLRATVTPDRRTTVELAIPRFGVRTIRLDDCAP